jgi:hypothetical protein
MASWKKIITEAELTTVSASLTVTDQSISSSVAALSGSASDARNLLVGDNSALSASLTVTDQAISSSVATLSGSASDARDLLVTKISGSSVAPIAALSSSLTSTDQVISSSVAALSGSASDARNLIVTDNTALSASLTVTDQSISSSVASLSGSASDSRDLLVTKISGSSTAAISALSASLTVTDQAISSSVAGLSGSASDARNLLVSQIADTTTLSFTSTVQGQFIADFNGTPETVDILDLSETSDPTFNDLQVNGSATVEGDLTVKGTTTTIQTTNLLVEDKFALFASGSTAATDGGLIIQAASDGSGKALGYSQANSRWSLQSSLAHDATTFSSVDAFLGTVETSTAIPSTAPIYGLGTMHIKTDTEDIYIYS